MSVCRYIAVAGILMGSLAMSAGAVLLTDTFESDTVGQPPSQWLTSDNWDVTDYSGNQVAENLDTSGDPTARHLDHSFGLALSAGWLVDFRYDWQWGGNGTLGNYDHIITMDMLDAGNNGYRVAVHQGTLNGGAADRLLEIYRLDAGVAGAALAQGQGYDHAGWKSLGLGAPALYPVRMAWDGSGQLTTYRDVGSGWESVATVGDSTYSSFTHILFGASGWHSTESPQLDDIEVSDTAVPEPASALLVGLGLWILRSGLQRKRDRRSA